MRIFDAIIIYLAVGAAFSANRLFRDHNVTISYRIVPALYYLVLWLPLTIWTGIKKFGLKNAENVIACDDFPDRLSEIETEFESLVTKSVAIPVFEFREIFARYVGLRTLSGGDYAPSDPVESIFDLSGHENADLGAKCLNRRNRSRLVFHQRMAANEFLRMIGVLAEAIGSETRISELSRELAVILNDGETADELTVYFNGKEELPEWNTKPNIAQSEAMSSNLRV